MHAQTSLIHFTLHIPSSLFTHVCHAAGKIEIKFFSAMVLYALQETHSQQLDSIYMQSGQSAHVATESAVRNMDVYSATDTAVSMARQSNHQFHFVDFRPLAKYLIQNQINNSEVSWLKVKHFEMYLFQI